MRMNQKVNRRTSSPPILRLRATERIFTSEVSSKFKAFMLFCVFHIHSSAFTDNNFRVVPEGTRL